MQENKNNKIDEWILPTFLTFFTLFTFVWLANWYKNKANEQQKKNFRKGILITILIMFLLICYQYTQVSIENSDKTNKYKEYQSEINSDPPGSRYPEYWSEKYNNDENIYGENSPQCLKDWDILQTIRDYNDVQDRSHDND